jgi:hypothetical protein
MRQLLPSLGCLILALSCLAQPCPAQTPNWTQIMPTTSPWSTGAMAYDSARKRSVKFGGYGIDSGTNLTWEWDGKNKTWTRITPTSTLPPSRGSHAMAYDSARQRTVLFGGYVGMVFSGSPVADTWEWDGKNWTQIKPTSTLPPARWKHALAYDSARQRTVLFGGSDINSKTLADTWEWDGKNWTQIKPTTTSPLARSSHAMAYDSARQRTVLFGGSDSNAKTLADTWEWDGKSWAQIKPTTSPAARVWHAMAYDSARKRTVLFAGWTGSSPLTDTWEWDGKNWTQIKPTTSPSSPGVMAYDSARQRTVLFGKAAGTWEYGSAFLALTTNTSTVSIATGGVQKFTLDAGTQHGTRRYWLFGSVTGTTSGVTLASAIGSVNIPLNPDIWTDYTIALANTAMLANTKATLDASGTAQASFNIRKVNLPSAIGLIFYHAYLVYDAKNNFYMASNPVTLTLVK